MDKIPDYSKYTLDQLYDVYDHIDRNRYPDRFKVVVDYIEKKKVELSSKKKVKEDKKDFLTIDENEVTYLSVIKLTRKLIVANFLVGNLILSFLPLGIGVYLFNILRISIIFMAGFLVLKRHVGGLWKAALSGSILLFVDHVILKGGLFLIGYLFRWNDQGLLAFGGVLVSYTMFHEQTHR